MWDVFYTRSKSGLREATALPNQQKLQINAIFPLEKKYDPLMKTGWEKKFD